MVNRERLIAVARYFVGLLKPSTRSADTPVADDEFVVYRCTECGKVFDGPGAIGALHAHAEKHRPFFSEGGNVEALMAYTEKLRITDYEKLEIEAGDVQ